MNSMHPDHSAPFIQLEFIAPNKISAISVDRILGLHCIGTEATSSANPLPMQCISTPLLNEDGNLLFELWRTNKPCSNGQFQDIKFRATDTLLFGVIEIDESTFDLNSGESTLCAAAESV